VILLASITLAFSVAVTAQTKVSKQIKVLDWLNVAVVDGNQVEGGLHTYDTWASLNGSTGFTPGVSPLKKAQIKIGMLVTITSELIDKNLNGTFRLKSWATNGALPLAGEWEHVGDLVIVDNITKRDALIVADKSLVSLAPGTTVVVNSNSIGVPETFIYAAGLFDANGDGTVKTDGTDTWYSPSSNVAGAGYIFVSQDAVPSAIPTVNLGNGVAKAQVTTAGTAAATPGTIAVGDARITSLPTGGVDFALTAGGNVPVVAIPAAWTNPVFYIYDGTNTYQLTDCWIKSYQTIDANKYQVWAVDNAFLQDATGTLTLQVR